MRTTHESTKGVAIATIVALGLVLVVVLAVEGSVRAWLITAVVAGAGAVVAGLVASGMSSAGSSLWRKASGQQPVRITAGPGLVQPRRAPFRAASYLVPDPSDLPEGPPPDGGPVERDRWLRGPGVVDAWLTNVQLLVEASSDTPVVLLDLTVEVHERTAPPKAAYIPPTGAGAVAVRYFHVDLDRSPPALRYEPGDEPTGPPIDFPYNVSTTKPEMFYIKANTREWDCRWTAELHWIAGGRRGVTVIDDDGRPFRTAAATNGTPYTWEAGGWVERPDDDP